MKIKKKRLTLYLKINKWNKNEMNKGWRFKISVLIEKVEWFYYGHWKKEFGSLEEILTFGTYANELSEK